MISRTISRTLLAVGFLILLGLAFGILKPRPAGTAVVSQTFLFTWSGDDGNQGTASSMQFRWSTTPIAGTDTLTWWNNATAFLGPHPIPKVAGTRDSVIVLGLPSDTVIYAIMKVCDEVPNCSGYSNVASGRTKDFTAPAPVTDLRFGLLELFVPERADAETLELPDFVPPYIVALAFPRRLTWDQPPV